MKTPRGCRLDLAPDRHAPALQGPSAWPTVQHKGMDHRGLQVLENITKYNRTQNEVKGQFPRVGAIPSGVREQRRRDREALRAPLGQPPIQAQRARERSPTRGKVWYVRSPFCEAGGSERTVRPSCDGGFFRENAAARFGDGGVPEGPHTCSVPHSVPPRIADPLRGYTPHPRFRVCRSKDCTLLSIIGPNSQ